MPSRIRPIDKATVIKWLEATHTATEAFNISRWLSDFMTPDLELRYFAHPQLQGPDAIRRLLSRLYSHLDSVAHEMQHVDYVPPRIYQSVRMFYELNGNHANPGPITVEALAVWHVNEEALDDGERRLRCYRLEIYGDLSEVTTKIDQKSKRETGSFDMF